MFNPLKDLPWPGRIVRQVVSNDATCGPGEEAKKQGLKLSCVKLAICSDHPHRCSPLKFCMLVGVREIVVYFKFHEHRLRGHGVVGVVNRHLSLTWPLAYSTACTTIMEAVTKTAQIETVLLLGSTLTYWVVLPF